MTNASPPASANSAGSRGSPPQNGAGAIVDRTGEGRNRAPVDPMSAARPRSLSHEQGFKRVMYALPGPRRAQMSAPRPCTEPFHRSTMSAAPCSFRRTALQPIDLEELDIEQLTDLLTTAQAEMASRERENRQNLRAELERRVAAEGYKLADIFPELAAASAGPARRKRPPRYRDPQNPGQTWSGIGRTPKWVQAILDERGIDVAAFKSIPMYRVHAPD